MAIDFDVVDQRPESTPNTKLVRVQFRPIVDEPFHSNVFHMQLFPTGKRLIEDVQGRLITRSGKLVAPDASGNFPPENPDDPYRRETFTRNNDAEMVANIEAYWERKLKAAGAGKPYPQHHNTTLNLQVGSGADDVFHRGGDHVLAANSISYSAGNNAASGQFTLFDSSARFTSVAIPVGSTIDAATLTLTPRVSTSGTVVRSNIRAHLDADSGQVANETAWHDDFADSGLTVALTAWDSIPAWTIDVEETSPDFLAVIQEVVDLGGWVSGNALHVFWLNDASDLGVGILRTGRSYNSDSAKAPKLDIDFEAAVGAVPQSTPAEYGALVGQGRGGSIAY